VLLCTRHTASPAQSPVSHAVLLYLTLLYAQTVMARWTNGSICDRPAVVISYAIGAILAMVSAVTFAEMAVDYPLAGSSFNYTLAVMGEFPAW